MNVPPWLSKLAPTVATALGGPLAGLAVNAIGDAIGVSNDKVQDLITDGKLSAEQLTQIKTAEIELKKQAQALGLNFEQLAVDDRKSAREMFTSTRSKMVPVLSILIVGSFIAVIVGTLLGYSKIESAMAGTLVGYLSAKAEQVVMFFFGSSSGSERKTELMATKNDQS